LPRCFNTDGPCEPGLHYLIAPEDRLPGLKALLENHEYFVIFAPPKQGMSTTALTLAAQLRSAGLVALHASLKSCRGFAEAGSAELQWMTAITMAAARWLGREEQPLPPPMFRARPPGRRLGIWLESWCRSLNERRLALLLDDADALPGPALANLLQQLRSGYAHRTEGRAPLTVVLLGGRALPERIEEALAGGPGDAPFDPSLSLEAFSPEQTRDLLEQHREDTGQRFSPEAVELIIELSQGRPSLVNALASGALLLADGHAATEAQVRQANAPAS